MDYTWQKRPNAIGVQIAAESVFQLYIQAKKGTKKRGKIASETFRVNNSHEESVIISYCYTMANNNNN